jgi:hypothetical protein
MRAVSRSLAQAHRPPDIRDGRSDRRTPVGSASQMPNAYCDGDTAGRASPRRVIGSLTQHSR